MGNMGIGKKCNSNMGICKSLNQCMRVKGWFHETTEMNEMYHRWIKIGRQVMQTSRHR